jgi:hypothetical protein
VQKGIHASGSVRVVAENSDKLFLVLASALVGAVLTRFIPFLWNLLLRVCLQLLRLIGGRYANITFERLYLDWLVTNLRELKLTGIVAIDETKKPQLEQVFVSLRLDESKEHEAPAPSEAFSQGLSALIQPNGPPSTWYDLLCTLRTALPNLDDAETLRDLSSALVQTLTSPTFCSIVRGLSSIERFFFIMRSYAGFARLALESLSSGARRRRESGGALTELIVRTARTTGMFLHAEVATDVKAILRHNQHVAILGAPGAGKSTLLQYVGLAYARDHAGDAKLRDHRILWKRLGTRIWRFPVYIPLSSVATMLTQKTATGKDPNLVDIFPKLLPPDLQRDYGERASDCLDRHLNDGTCILLLDGLDEVSTESEFRAVVRTIEGLTARYRKTQFVVSSRIAGWRTGVGPDFRTQYVNDFSSEQTDSFIDTWYTAVERNAVIGSLRDEGAAERKARQRRAEERAGALKQALRENAGLRRLAVNPMLLSIIALVHRSIVTLPKERGKLYAQCTKILLEQWDISRGVRVDDTQLKLGQKEAIMRRVAYAFHTGEIGDENGGREAGESEIVAVISALLPGLGREANDARRLLKILIDRSGILVERRRGVLAFSHLTFQEYFAAEYLTGIDHHGHFLVRDRLLSDWWREVILLYTGLLSDATEFLSLVFDLSNDDLCKQRLRLAGLCLGEAVEVRRADLRHAIVVALLRVRVLGKRIRLDGIPRPSISTFLVQWAKGLSWFDYAVRASLEDADELKT